MAMGTLEAFAPSDDEHLSWGYSRGWQIQMQAPMYTLIKLLVWMKGCRSNRFKKQWEISERA